MKTLYYYPFDVCYTLYRNRYMRKHDVNSKNILRYFHNINMALELWYYFYLLQKVEDNTMTPEKKENIILILVI